MRAPALASLLLLAGCIAYEEPAQRPPPPGPQASVPPQPQPQAAPPQGPPQAQPPAPPAAHGLIPEQRAVEIAFQVARERGLEVSRVQSARLDRTGRWHVEVRGEGDRARVLLDGRDGRLLKGKFREKEKDRGPAENEQWRD